MSFSLSQWFDLDNNGTDVKTEVLAGITIFMASMYIITVNPTILHAAGMPFSAVLTATVLVSAFSSIMMGLCPKNPILVAPGMGRMRSWQLHWSKQKASRGESPLDVYSGQD